MSRALAAIALLLLLASCAKPAATEAARAKRDIPPAAATELYGGDARSWVGRLGDMQDSNVCRARLKLPLAPQPSWEYEYSSAEFSSYAPNTLLHYDGTLLASSFSPQLLELDAAGGKLLLNRDVYLRSRYGSNQEAFAGMFLSPRGRVLCNDVNNRFYCFALSDLTLLWDKRVPSYDDNESSAIVVDAERAYGTWGLPRSWNLHGVGIEDGAEQWMYPYATPNPQGVTLSRSGVLLCYATPGELRAVDAATGQSMWTVITAAPVQLAPIDEARQAVHMILRNETVECRDLRDGTLRWKYDWSGVLPEAEREQLAQRVSPRLREAGVSADTIQPGFMAYCIGPDSSYLGAFTGHVVRIGPEGRQVWQTRLDATLEDLLLFDNALLAVQAYSYPSESRPNEADPYSLDPPAWRQPAPPAESKGSFADRRVWCRLAALDLRDGAMLSSVEPATLVESNLCPAGTRLVFGGARNGSGSQQRQRHYITAYEWLEP